MNILKLINNNAKVYLNLVQAKNNLNIPNILNTLNTLNISKVFLIVEKI